MVEDEIEVLSAMIETIPWNTLGFDRPIGSRDGKDAIAVLEGGFVPDVIITDIAMPFLTGLELAIYAKEKLPKTIVVILSGYDDFHYAQKAVEINVYKYLLKPIIPRKIKELLIELSEELAVRKEDAKDSKTIIRNHFFNQLLFRKMDSFVIYDKINEYQLSFDLLNYSVITLDVDLVAPKDIGARNNLDLMRYGLFNITQELGNQNSSQYIFLGNDGLVKIIVGTDSNNCEKIALNFATKVSDTFNDKINLTVSGGIGSPVNQLEFLHQSHSESLESLSRRFYTGKQSIVTYRDVEKSSIEDIDYRYYEEQLDNFLVNLDKTSVIDLVNLMVMDLGDKRPSANRCGDCCQKLMTFFIKKVREFVDSANIDDLLEYWESINFYTIFSLKQLQEVMITLITKAFEPLDSIRENPAMVQMIKAEQYIKNNYFDPTLSLNNITEYLAVSTSYFSVNFKTRTGLTFVEYLTNIRMNKAKSTLKMTNKRTYEVAAEVGFSDPHYFSASFKKFVGISPKEYREVNQVVNKDEL